MLARIMIAGWLALGSASGQPSQATNPAQATAHRLATTQSLAVAQSPEQEQSSASAQSPARALWIDVPFVAQTSDGCGSATLAMVIRYWQRAQHAPMTADAAAIQRQLFDPRAHGIYASRMVAYLRRAGFAAYAFHGDWSDLEHHVALGRPLIVALRDGGAHGPLHYVVVVGASADAVLVNDPARQQRLRLVRDGFLKAWSATDDWTLLAVPQKAAVGTS